MKTAKFFSLCLLVIGALMAAPLAHAQIAISNDGVTFPDNSEQTSAVIVPMNCPHGDSIVWDSNAASWVCATDLSPIYAIGDTGPAGGIVFYITDGGLDGLEAALVDQSTGAEWGCYLNTIAGADGLAIGTGAQNTEDILAGCATPDIAARVAASDELNGYSDWFLPSREELNLMYQNKDTIGGFASVFYWSSSELDGHGAWGQLFSNGGQSVNGKDNTFRVRAVRAF